MRKELDCSPTSAVKVPSEGIDWVFFRENTEEATPSEARASTWTTIWA